MKMLRTLFFSSFALGVASLIAAPVANKLDRDGDGKISRAEYPGTPEEFARLDHNHDGVLDAQELRGPGGTSAKEARVQHPQRAMPDDIVMDSDVVYKTVNGEKLAFDFYRVKGRKYDRAPLVVWIHGGGYVKGSKDGAVKHNSDVLVPLMMEHGYLVASVEYRLCSVGGPKITDCYTDCKDAVRFLVKHAAEYGIDPTRIVTIGSSAGGGLALMMAYGHDADLPGDPSLADVKVKVAATVSWFGVTDFRKTRDEFAQGETKRLVLFNDKAGEAEGDALSPVWYMNRYDDKIPTLLVHGDQDPVVPYNQSVWMKSEADRLGRPVEFMPIRNMRHGFQPGAGEITPPLTEIWQRTFAFILKANGS